MPNRPQTFRADQTAASETLTRQQLAALYKSHRWKQASQRYRAEHPLCINCLQSGKLTSVIGPNGVVDHITNHRCDPRLFWDRNNWQPLCRSCNAKKK
jgi:5-methylcytosine-specific restriction protein A